MDPAPTPPAVLELSNKKGFAFLLAGFAAAGRGWAVFAELKRQLIGGPIIVEQLIAALLIVEQLIAAQLILAQLLLSGPPINISCVNINSTEENKTTRQHNDKALCICYSVYYLLLQRGFAPLWPPPSMFTTLRPSQVK